MLETDNTINLGIEGSALRVAQPGKAITYCIIDFDKLAALDSLKDISSVVKSVNNTIVPLVNQGNVVTVVEISQHEKGWKVTGLANAGFSRNLQALFAQPDYNGYSIRESVNPADFLTRLKSELKFLSRIMTLH